jgi:hypothetical protein
LKMMHNNHSTPAAAADAARSCSSHIYWAILYSTASAVQSQQLILLDSSRQRRRSRAGPFLLFNHTFRRLREESIRLHIIKAKISGISSQRRSSSVCPFFLPTVTDHALCIFVQYSIIWNAVE